MFGDLKGVIRDWDVNTATARREPDGRRIAQLVSLSPNGNGRKLVDGIYQGCSAKILLLEF